MPLIDVSRLSDLLPLIKLRVNTYLQEWGLTGHLSKLLSDPIGLENSPITLHTPRIFVHPLKAATSVAGQIDWPQTANRAAKTWKLEPLAKYEAQVWVLYATQRLRNIPAQDYISTGWPANAFWSFTLLCAQTEGEEPMAIALDALSDGHRLRLRPSHRLYHVYRMGGTLYLLNDLVHLGKLLEQVNREFQTTHLYQEILEDTRSINVLHVEDESEEDRPTEEKER